MVRLFIKIVFNLIVLLLLQTIWYLTTEKGFDGFTLLLIAICLLVVSYEIRDYTEKRAFIRINKMVSNYEIRKEGLE